MSELPGATAPRPPVGRRSRQLAIVLWCSFLAASAATMVAFALLDPQAMHGGEPPHWWTTRLTVYGLGFFFFWLIAAAASALTLFMIRTEHES